MEHGENVADELMKLVHRVHSAAKRRIPDGPGEKDGSCKKGGRGCRGRGLGGGRLIEAVRKNSGISQSELAKLLDIRPQSLSEAVKRLEKEGLIEISRSESDRREHVLFATPLALEREEKMHEQRVEFAERFFSPLTDKEKEELFALLSKLTDDIERKGGKGL